MADTQPVNTQRPRVLMLLGSDVVMDGRVKKSAATLAAAGLSVTVLSYTADARPRVSRWGEVTVTEVPVPWRLRDQRNARRNARQQRTLRAFGFRSPRDEQVARLRLYLRERELVAAQGGVLSRADRSGAIGPIMRGLGALRLSSARLGVRWRSFALRRREPLQRRLDAKMRLLWRVTDKISSKVTVGATWHRLLPEVQDYEIAFGELIDEIDPDVIHAHDVNMIGVAARAAGRARARGKRILWVYDAHEYVAGLALYGRRTPRWVAAWRDLERESIRTADGVITVSPEIADRLLRDYRLSRRPTVVLNCPVESSSLNGRRTVREAAGLPQEVPLLVYAGGLAPGRGLATAIEALTQLPDVHLAFVCVPSPRVPHAETLQALAEQRGVSDRVHFLDPVAPGEVPHFVSTADVAIHTMRHFLNHEVTLPNKLFEYIHAGVPVAVSDVRAMASFVRDHDIGKVFAADDSADLARAVRAVLDKHGYFAEKIRHPELRRRYSWSSQAISLLSFYEQLLSMPLKQILESATAMRAISAQDRIIPDHAARRKPCVVIGPANMAGQGWAWARAVERHRGVAAHVIAVDRGFQRWPADELVKPEDFMRSTSWQLREATRLLDIASHVLMEAGRPILGTLNGRTFDGDVPMLRQSGITVGLVFHGSEIRDPAWHARHYPWSPFSNPKEALTRKLQMKVASLKPMVAAFDGPKFYSTPDLLDDVPDGIWLPVTIDTSVWVPGKPPLERKRPVVLHAPSNAALKGTHHIDPVMQRLDAEGLVEYRRVEGVSNATLPEVIADADIVVDHIGIGNYGVFTCEAMAAGRVTLSYIHDRVRVRVPLPVPVIEVRPDSLQSVITRIIAEREWAVELAASGPEFVSELHDGRRAAAVLAQSLGL